MALEKATITNLETGELLSVMFNPGEYSLDLGNTFAEIGIPGVATPPIQYVRGNGRTLRMELFFDTSVPPPSPRQTVARGTDVRVKTRQITALLEHDATTQAPPVLLFSWGGLNFRCVLESAGQRFTMFLEDGTPVRATLTVAFREYEAVAVEVRRGLFLGPPTVRTIVEGETLSKIAGEVLGDPGAWREIARLNDIDNPRLPPLGLPVVVPPRRTPGPG